MKNRLLVGCKYTSAILFFGIICVYLYVWIANPDPIETLSGPDWRSVVIGRWKIGIAHSLQPSRDKNRPGMLTYLEDGGGNVHFALQRSDVREMSGCYFVVHNQNFPYELNTSLAFIDSDNPTNDIGFRRFGLEFGLTRYRRMLNCAETDRTSMMVLTGYGIFFSKISHTVDKVHNWWTFMISLWYPVVIFGILPAVYVVQKIRGTKLVTQSEGAKT